MPHASFSCVSYQRGVRQTPCLHRLWSQMKLPGVNVVNHHQKMPLMTQIHCHQQLCSLDLTGCEWRMRHSLDSWTSLPLKRQHVPGRGTPEGVTEGVAVLNRHFSIAVRAIVKVRHGIERSNTTKLQKRYNQCTYLQRAQMQWYQT